MQVFEIINKIGDLQFKGLVGFARFITFDDDPNLLEEAFQKCGEGNFKGHIVMHSLQGELLAWAVIHAYVNKCLSAFDTTLEQDKKLI